MKHKTQILIFLAMIFLVSVFSGAKAEVGVVEEEYQFEFRLYYDHGKILPDKSAENVYDVMPKSVEINKASGTYKLEVLSMAGKQLYSAFIDPQGGDAELATAKFTAYAPYFPNAGKVNILDGAGNSVFKIDISKTAICNENRTCNPENGESADVCPLDCFAKANPSPSPTASATAVVTSAPTQVLPEQADEIPADSSDSNIKLLLGIGSAVAVLAVFYFYRKIKSAQT